MEGVGGCAGSDFAGMSGSTTPAVARAAGPSNALKNMTVGDRRQFTGPERNIMVSYHPCTNMLHRSLFIPGLI